MTASSRSFDLVSYLHRQKRWSSTTFGADKRTVGITKHIAKELDEIRLAPLDVTEWIDVVILALDGAWRAGHSPEQICRALADKQDVNMARKWPKPQSEDEATEHIKE